MTGCGSSSTPPTAGSAPKKSPTAAATPADAESGDQTNVVRSAQALFELVPGGKDPFFPLTQRIPSAATADPAAVETKPQLPLSSYLAITGLRPSATRPLVLINDTIFAPGEEGTVQVTIPLSQGGEETHTVRIECLEIGNDSVLIRVDGEPGYKRLSPPAQP
jgi:hypothetical protein